MDRNNPYETIWLTPELEGWDALHWCQDKITDEDIEYVLADRECECKNDSYRYWMARQAYKFCPYCRGKIKEAT